MYFDIEKAWRNGELPSTYYFQMNGKSAEENLNEQRRLFMEQIRKRKAEEQAKKELEKEVQQKVEAVLDETLEELFKGFKI